MHVELARLLDYDRWANEEILATLRNTTDPPERALTIFAHVAAVHRLFLSRILNGDPVVVWPAPDLDETQRALAGAYVQWKEVLSEKNPDEKIDYVNTQGVRWHSRIDDIITHIAIHSAYHRGQVAILLGTAGTQPPLTDFVHATRADLF